METLFLKCTVSGESQRLENFEFKYLYCLLYKFSYSINDEFLDKNREETTISSIDVRLLHGILKEELMGLINSFYVLPEERKRSKYPGRYEKIQVENKNYIVDYTFSKMGRLMYTIFIRMAFLKRVFEMNSSLTLSVINVV